ARNEFSGPESIVNAQSVMLARDGTLYYDLNSYPHTVSAYTPLFYLLETGLIKVGLPAVTAGRLLSFAALLGIFALIWRLLLLWFQRPKAALRFGATLAAAVLALVLAINAALNGRFLQDIVLANLNPFDLKKFGLHIRYLFAAAGQLILIAAAGIKRVRYGRG